MDRYASVIGGRDVDTEQVIDVLDPATGETFAEVAAGRSADVDAAVVAAQAAFPAWSRTTPAVRGRLLRNLAGLITTRRGELAALESRDTGKPMRQAYADVDVAARYFEFYAGAAEALYGDTMTTSPDHFSYTLRQPFGVTGHIVPWNYPLQIGARTVAPALAAGNCSVLKPAEEAPLGPVMLGRLAREAGIPDGVLNVVPGYGTEAGAALAAHRGIAHLSFTGSNEVGELVAVAAAANHVPVVLELGGKSPNVVFEDADLDAAVPVITTAILQNAGQTCSAGSRLLVHRAIHAELVDRLAEAFAAVRVGPGAGDPDLGPLISGGQRERVAALVGAAVEGGNGRLRHGGGVPTGLADGGFFFEPTLIDGVDPTSAIAQQEVFGPVLVVTPFDTEEEALRLANGTEYGLIAALWTRDVGRAHRMARDIHAGQVYVNTYGAGGGVELPFGGVKKSGHGREKGFEGLLGYTQVKSVVVRT
ncbi:MAG TPA: aldehyde dehydrogenase family protein [Blastococcus sp.]